MTPVCRPGEVAAIAEAVRRDGRLFFDLEFVSEGRYVPELALVQVAWGDPERPRVAAVDPLAVDLGPLTELIAAPALATVVHAAQGDLALLAMRLGVEARSVVDTQIAAAFLGLGDQVGYATLVETLLGFELDKSHQFTAWLERPLADEQLRYALDDVRYLPALWRLLSARLAERGRTAWVEEESQAVARGAAERPPPEEAYRRLRGWEALRPRALGALRAAAAWREREALATNTPPRWLIGDRALVEACRRLPRDERGLLAIRGIGPATVRRHGAALLEALERGAAEPPPAPIPPQRLNGLAKRWRDALSGLIQERCREAEIAPRFVATRGDVERLVRWWLANGAGAGGRGGERDAEPDLPLLRGWRREVAGGAALAWLAGATRNPS